jgi:hypothetical protein
MIVSAPVARKDGFRLENVPEAKSNGQLSPTLLRFKKFARDGSRIIHLRLNVKR